MYSMWISLKDNANCGSKLSDVLRRPEAGVKDRKKIYGKRNPESKNAHLEATPDIVTDNYIQPYYKELNIGDPSRNVIERIFQASLSKSSKHSRRIHNVYKVLNSYDNLERFEKYREMVKRRASVDYVKHPRSVVDGNELLRFFGTTILCCDQKSDTLSDLCDYSACGLCRILESDFSTKYVKNGIRLSTCSEDLSENSTANSKVKNMKRAAVVCRTIAGRVINKVNRVDEDGYYSTESDESSLHAKAKYLTVKSSNAVLPCFVIVFT